MRASGRTSSLGSGRITEKADAAQAASIAFCADLRLALALSDQPSIMLDVCVVDKALHL
jgi:hypothetical protein